MRELVESLIAKARSFSYENFAEFSSRGYPIRLTPTWVSWMSEVEQFMSRCEERHPRSVHLFQQARAVELIGCRRETFEDALGYVTIALSEALRDTEYENQSKRKKIKDVKVFIVHGADSAMRYELKDYLQNTLHLHEPIVLDEKPGKGRTIIEKFEEESSDVDIVFVLLTPDDEAIVKDRYRRARQNVIFEIGYFAGVFGRRSGKVILLYKEPVEIPSDLSGVSYVNVSAGIIQAGEKIRKEIQHLIER
jgi:predicted nucleotide-binding protein